MASLTRLMKQTGSVFDPHSHGVREARSCRKRWYSLQQQHVIVASQPAISGPEVFFGCGTLYNAPLPCCLHDACPSPLASMKEDERGSPRSAITNVA